MVRQRGLQKGKSAAALLTGFLQVGQRTWTARFDRIEIPIVEGIRLRVKNGFRLDDLLLDDLRHQIVIVGFGDLAAIELAGLGIKIFGEVVHENLAVDFRSMHRSAAFEQEL
jgi:hypothetical protein